MLPALTGYTDKTKQHFLGLKYTLHKRDFNIKTCLTAKVKGPMLQHQKVKPFTHCSSSRLYVRDTTGQTLVSQVSISDMRKSGLLKITHKSFNQCSSTTPSTLGVTGKKAGLEYSHLTKPVSNSVACSPPTWFLLRTNRATVIKYLNHHMIQKVCICKRLLSSFATQA